jgi:hypothetical protein
MEIRNGKSSTEMREVRKLAGELFASAMADGPRRGISPGGVLAAFTLTTGWLLSLGVQEDGSNVGILVRKLSWTLRDIATKEAARRRQQVQ